MCGGTPEQGDGKERTHTDLRRYDVDGTTAVALVYKFIQQFYSNIDYYDRYNEGYGVSSEDDSAETGVGLIIARLRHQNCQMKSLMQKEGIDFIVQITMCPTTYCQRRSHPTPNEPTTLILHTSFGMRRGFLVHASICLQQRYRISSPDSGYSIWLP